MPLLKHWEYVIKHRLLGYLQNSTSSQEDGHFGGLEKAVILEKQEAQQRIRRLKATGAYLPLELKIEKTKK